MTGGNGPFRPIQGSNATFAATASTGSARLALVIPNAGAHAQLRVRILNIGPSEAFVALGGASVTVTAGGAVSNANDGGFCLPVGAIEVFELLPGDTNLVAICASGGTATLRASIGYGV